MVVLLLLLSLLLGVLLFDVVGVGIVFGSVDVVVAADRRIIKGSNLPARYLRLSAPVQRLMMRSIPVVTRLTYPKNDVGAREQNNTPPNG